MAPQWGKGNKVLNTDMRIMHFCQTKGTSELRTKLLSLGLWATIHSMIDACRERISPSIHYSLGFFCLQHFSWSAAALQETHTVSVASTYIWFSIYRSDFFFSNLDSAFARENWLKFLAFLQILQSKTYCCWAFAKGLQRFQRNTWKCVVCFLKVSALTSYVSNHHFPKTFYLIMHHFSDVWWRQP